MLLLFLSDFKTMDSKKDLHLEKSLDLNKVDRQVISKVKRLGQRLGFILDLLPCGNLWWKNRVISQDQGRQLL